MTIRSLVVAAFESGDEYSIECEHHDLMDAAIGDSEQYGNLFKKGDPARYSVHADYERYWPQYEEGHPFSSLLRERRGDITNSLLRAIVRREVTWMSSLHEDLIFPALLESGRKIDPLLLVLWIAQRVALPNSEYASYGALESAFADVLGELGGADTIPPLIEFAKEENWIRWEECVARGTDSAIIAFYRAIESILDRCVAEVPCETLSVLSRIEDASGSFAIQTEGDYGAPQTGRESYFHSLEGIRSKAKAELGVRSC